MSDEILQPRPRRVFNLAPSPNDSEPSTPAEPSNPDLLTPKDAGSASVSRTGSIMNLTSSTLYGIYSPTAFESSRDESSPWGTEAHTPATEKPNPLRRSEGSEGVALQMTRSRLSYGLFRGVILPLTLKSALLFGFGIVYGIITIHLHENHWITPVKLENTHFYGSLEYLGFWGLAGVALGNVLPFLDSFSDEATESSKPSRTDEGNEERTRSWVAVVRSVGAFVGVAFALRRAPWESTTQASATLALVNPVLWYLIDRTTTGFLMSTVVGVAGMGVLLGLCPELVPSSASGVPIAPTILNGTLSEYGLTTAVTQESLAVRIWVASVMFCACVCFGNIGRQLAINARRDGVKS